MTDFNLSAKIFFGIAAGCIVLLILIVAVKKLPWRIKLEEWMPPPPPWMHSPLFVMGASKEPIQETPPTNDADTLEKRVARLETKLAKVEKRVHNTDMLDDNLIVRAFAVWAHYLVAMFILAIFFALVFCLFSVVSNLSLPSQKSSTPTPTIRPINSPVLIPAVQGSLVNAYTNMKESLPDKRIPVFVAVRITNTSSSTLSVAYSHCVITDMHGRTFQLGQANPYQPEQLKPLSSATIAMIFYTADPYDHLIMTLPFEPRLPNYEMSIHIPISLPH